MSTEVAVFTATEIAALDPAMREAAVTQYLVDARDRLALALEDQVAIIKLGKIHGGVNGLLGRAEHIRRQTGIPRNHAVAAAAVEILNTGRGGNKLPAWFRENAA